jgi:hypothetical protein
MPFDLDDTKRAGLAPWCPCGSGNYRESQYDGHGIFLTYTCTSCHAEKMQRFRADIFKAYDADEAIDAD